MSYALGQTPQRANDPTIRVGSKAGKDIILAQASYDASQVLLRAAERPRGTRLAFIRRQMRYYGSDGPQRFERERATLLRRGWAPNQATYDAMRLVASNKYAKEGLQAIRAALAQHVSGEYAEGLGDDTGRQVGCGITGGVTAIGSLVAGIYTGGAGAGAVGAGGSIAGQALDCNREGRESQERIAAAQAQAAQATANAALAQAQAEAAAEAEKTKQIKTVAIVGGVVLLLLGTGYAIVKV